MKAQYFFKGKSKEELEKLDVILKQKCIESGIDYDLDIFYQDEIREIAKTITE